MLLDAHPEAAKVVDNNGFYPLQIAAHTFNSFTAFKSLIDIYPQAAEAQVKQKGAWSSGYTALLRLLRLRDRINEERYRSIHLLLETCPWSASLDDGRVLVVSHYLDMAGDALDYVCAKYCHDIVRVNFYDVPQEAMESAADPEYIQYRWYSEASMECMKNLSESQRIPWHDPGCYLWKLLHDVLRLMYGRPNSPFLPLHAMCTGRLCRPWHLPVIKALMHEFNHHLVKEDSRAR